MHILDDSSQSHRGAGVYIPIITSDGTTTYPSRPTLLELSGHPILTDFGQMRFVEGHVNQDWWMSDLYRAPEELLKLPWEYAVDLFAVGIMVGQHIPTGIHTYRV